MAGRRWEDPVGNCSAAAEAGAAEGKKKSSRAWRVGGRGFIDTNLAPPSADHNVTMDFWNAQPDCKLWRVAMRAVLAVAVR